MKKINFDSLKMSKKLRYIVVGAGILVLVVGVSACKIITSSDKSDFYTTLYDGSKIATNIGEFKYSLELESSNIKDNGDNDAITDDEVSDSSEAETDGNVKDKSSSKVDDTSDEDSSLKSSSTGKNFSGTWTSADGVKTVDKSVGKSYASYTFSGVTESLKPLKSRGTISYSSSASNKKLNILNYTVIDGTWYIDVADSKKSLMESGDKFLTKLGEEMPSISSVVKFDGDSVAFDNVFGADNSTNIQDMDYVNERKKFLRMLNTAITELKNSVIDVKPSFTVKQDNRFYFTVNKDSVPSFKKTLDSISSNMGNSFDSYIENCKKDNIYTDSQAGAIASMKDNILDVSSKAFSQFNNFLSNDNLDSVNWVRLSGDKGKRLFEISSKFTWEKDGLFYYTSLTGSHKETVPSITGIEVPKISVPYYETGRDVSQLSISRLINDIVAVAKSPESPLDESRLEDSTTK